VSVAANEADGRGGPGAHWAHRAAAALAAWGAHGRPDRAFRIALAGAVALHAALLLALIGSAPRHMGEPDGSRDAISVDIVDAAELAARAAPPPAAGAPRPPAAQRRRENAAAPPGQAPAAEPPAALEAPGQRPPRETGGAPGSAIDESLLTLPPRPPLHLTVPDAAMAAGRSAAVTRPPGVTRSGENDEFGRGVIRALRQTMPYPADTIGRVTVRLLLSDTGDLADLRLVSGSGNPALDQSVLFAVRQASFPIPPAGSPLRDRTFLVTYVYR